MPSEYSTLIPTTDHGPCFTPQILHWPASSAFAAASLYAAVPLGLASGFPPVLRRLEQRLLHVVILAALLGVCSIAVPHTLQFVIILTRRAIPAHAMLHVGQSTRSKCEVYRSNRIPQIGQVIPVFPRVRQIGVRFEI